MIYDVILVVSWIRVGNNEDGGNDENDVWMHGEPMLMHGAYVG